MGTAMGRSAIRDSFVVPTAPSLRATSVDVPPMSKVMMRSKPARCATYCAPTMPPAGPESTARTGILWGETGGLVGNIREIAGHYRSEVGVGDGGRGALEFAKFGENFVRNGNVEACGAQGVGDGAFV